MDSMPLIISDETLRDGEQQAGLFFSADTKLELAYRILETGVHHTDIMPVIHETEARVLRTLVQVKGPNRVVAATMLNIPSIDQAKACGAEQIILFYGISDRLLLLRDPEVSEKYKKGADVRQCTEQVRQNMLKDVAEHISYATQRAGLKVIFAAEDASRTDYDLLVQCVRDFGPHIECFLLCDTVGALHPSEVKTWIEALKKSDSSTQLGVHFHNDMGLALENTIQGVLAGATMVSGTFTGIGERAGNAPLEQVLRGLRLRFGIEVDGINYDRLQVVCDELIRLNAHPATPYSPEAQRHETGIHLHALLEDLHSYYIFECGVPEVWFGKCSGASNFKYLFERILFEPLPKDMYSHMAARVKNLSITEQRSFAPNEIIALYRQGFFND